MGTNNASFAWVRYNFTGDVNLAENPSVYFAVPAGKYDNLGIVLVSDNGSNAIYANNSHSVDRSTVKQVSASAINLTNHTPKSPVSLVGTTGNVYEDYASCYMVPPTAGAYEFECKLADGTDLKGKGGVTAEIKWAEQAGMINDVCYNPETNKISFKTNGKEGNALISLTDNTNSGTTALWIWHIWITDTPKVLNINGGGNRTANQYYLMDRVVGATWAPSSTITADASKTFDSKEVPMCKTISPSDAADACGLYFQYQNRVPLPRIKDMHVVGGEDITKMANTRCDVMYGFTQYGQYWTKSTSAGNVWTDKRTGLYIFNNINYPNYEYTVSGTTSNTNGWVLANIYNKATTGQAVNVDDGYKFWSNNTSMVHEEMLASKTAYDPCPPGYVIETSSCQYSYQDLRKKDAGFARAASESSSYSEGYKFYGFYFNLAKDKDNNPMALYFPCGGNRSSCVSNLSSDYGNMGYVYSANTQTDAITATVNNKTYTYHVAAASQYGANTSGKTIGWPGWSKTKKVNAQAYHVRCRRGKF